MADVRPIRLIVLDNNGTALDDLPIAYGNVKALYDVLGLPVPSLEEYRNEIRADFMQFFWDHGVPRDITGELVNAIRKLYYRMRQDSPRYREDLPEFLRTCLSTTVLVGICSAEIPEVLIGFLERERIHDWFPSNMICGGAFPSKVPVLSSMAKVAGLNPSQCAYVGDTDDDIFAAKEAGFLSIAFDNPTGYNSSERLRGAGPDKVVTSFTDLRHALPKLMTG